MKLINNILALSATSLILFSCGEDSLDPTQGTFTTTDDIVSVNDLSSTLNGAYNRMSIAEYYGRDYEVYGEVYSDNAFANGNSGRFVTVDEMILTENSGNPIDLWDAAYRTIAVANLALAVELDQSLQNDLYNHLKGEAYAIRALAHYDLLKYFGQQHVGTGGESALGIPYVVVFRPEGNDLLPSRPTVAQNKASIYQDLEKAYSVMSTTSDRENAYINKYAVKAIEARVANYFGDYQRAKDAAEMVINSGNYVILDSQDYVNSWKLEDSPNWIFKIVNTDTDNLGINGLSNIYQDTSYGDVQAYDDIINLFTSSDVRGLSSGMLKNSNGIRNYGKYPSINPSSYNIPLIRFEEIVLIYAEALYNLGDAANALTWLNKIPSARGADVYSTINDDNILLERRKELIFEGFRFHDLARKGKAIPVVNQFINTPVPYGDYRFAFPIPAREMTSNSAMVQNQGY